MACQTEVSLSDGMFLIREITEHILPVMVWSVRRESQTLSSRRLDPKPSGSFYPGKFLYTFRLDERWGSCYTAHDAGFVRTAGYNNRLVLSKAITLEGKETRERKLASSSSKSLSRKILKFDI